jgi:enoyl-CoA hydratase
MTLLRKNTIVLVSFDDVETKNSFTLKKAEALVAELEAATTDIVIFKSQGSVFCSGGNLRDYASMQTKEEGIQVNSSIRDILRKIDNLPIYKLALVSGDCFGGGIEVLSLCDQIYARDHVVFGLWQSRMHLTFGWGGFERIKRRMNPLVVQNWLFEGSTHSAQWCVSNGFINSIKSRSQLEEIEQNVLQASPTSVHWKNIREMLQDEDGVFASLWGTESHLKALEKYLSPKEK